MIPAKPNWKKLTHRLSPLLVLSLGLHGLLLLIPVPKEAEIREDPPETELLEPIQVSALPKPSLSEATSEPTAITPPGGAPSEPQRSPEPAPIPSSVPRISPQAATPAPSSAPRPPSDQTAPSGDAVPGDADPGNPADGPTSDRPQKTDPIPQAYSREGTSEGDASGALSEFITFNPVPFKKIQHALPLAFPSDDYCFEDYPEPPASLIVLVENTPSGLDAVDGGIIQKTGYASIDKWIGKSVFPSDAVDPNANAVEIPEVAPVDILAWITDNVNGPVLEPDEMAKAYTFGVKVELINNPCE